MRRPRVSALVTYYGKSPFFAEALRSATDQSIPQEDYEVVVVTDQPRADIGIGPLGPRVSVVSSQEQQPGRFFLDGIRACSGDIISFLNHDDMWEPGKVASVDRAFREYPDIGFYHNGVRLVDEFNIESPGLARYRGFASKHSLRRVFHPPYLESIGFYGLGFNDSSISILKQAILKQGRFLEKITTSEDTFLFYVAMASRMGLYLDPEPLTRYRLHSANSSVTSQTGKGMAVIALKKVFENRLKTYRVIEEMVRDCRDADLVSFIGRDLSVYALLCSLFETSRSATVLSRVWDTLPHLPIFNSRVNAVIVGLGLLHIVSPSLPRKLIMKVGM